MYSGESVGNFGEPFYIANDFLLAMTRPSVCLHESMIHFEAFLYVESGKHKIEDLSSSPPLPWEH